MSAAADSVRDTIIALARDLIRIPSRAGSDPPDPIVKLVIDWCRSQGLPVRTLQHAGELVGVVIDSPNDDGVGLCFDTCIDTAAFGDESKWTYAPTSGELRGNRLYGRGAADSKTGAAIFLVLMRELLRDGHLTHSRLHLLLDADEHTGKFGGVKEFVRTTPSPSAVWLGYPGNNTIVSGSRGYLRGCIAVSGTAAHSGSKRRRGVNAIVRAAHLVTLLDNTKLPEDADPDFPFGPSSTVTAIHGGEGFSVVPDLVRINLDLRLTRTVDESRMRSFVESRIREFDAAQPGPHKTTVEWKESWPAFKVPDEHPAILCLKQAAESVFAHKIVTAVSGPSNIGNYLASFGIPTMAGFGVTYDNVHATDEWCDTETIVPVYEAYKRAACDYFEVAVASPGWPGQDRPP